MLRGVLLDEIYPRTKLWEFYQVNVEKAVEQFRKLLQAGKGYQPLRICISVSLH